MARGNNQWTQNQQSPAPRRQSRWPRAIGLLLIAGLSTVVIFGMLEWTPEPEPASGARTGTRRLEFFNRSQKTTPSHIKVWWDDIPTRERESASQVNHPTSNIHPDDYVGPDACRECHQKNHEGWSKHPHRWMNALANTSTVVGDFSGTSISYLGGTVTFFKEDGEYRMRLERETTQTYTINQTIGSRFFQYYVGRQIDGTEATDLPKDPQEVDHVLPLGYWIEPGEWVPIVNTSEEEAPDGRRMDPFDPISYRANFAHYADACDQCHTTSPLGDLLSGNANQLAREVPRNMQWSVADYLAAERSEWLPPDHESLRDEEAIGVLVSLDAIPASDHAVTLGISCESCHLGCREHVEDPKVLPAFFPHSPHLYSEFHGQQVELGRTHDNVNWACGRCHSGNRPQFAGGMATWNSTEYSDAMRGSCYSQLTCVHCHNPHQATGSEWSFTAAEDDARCISCHQQYESSEAQAAHSHHPAGSEGSRCMNCHMPRINEGLQDIVRTHTIFSPTNRDMMQANHPNACNQCHTDKSTEWTIGYLNNWFGSTLDNSRLRTKSADRSQSAALSWLRSDNDAVRKAAADSLFRTRSLWGQDDTILQALINALDDPYLINRQFARRGFEKMLHVSLQDYGYQFYMTPEERKAPMAKLRPVLSSAFAKTLRETGE